ncbi:hypothetical protein HII36_41515 [Nonomuraea sp. NN258]|uniref:hypothetical protein n=1 Tax=Nonomuraea antri TaxID=2730852 RepID=UPI00156A6046|nr:hypothetical protein [Nonomuraea antri]NRQ38266.1 hypothetical protein [Nonomuraea antri]
MSYAINTEADLEVWSFDDLETFLKADAYNAEFRPELGHIINPELGLELIYRPVGYIVHS